MIWTLSCLRWSPTPQQTQLCSTHSMYRWTWPIQNAKGCGGTGLSRHIQDINIYFYGVANATDTWENVRCAAKRTMYWTKAEQRYKGLTFIGFYVCALALQENYGDISERLLLRKKLKCNSFDWYLKNIYPDLHVPEDRAGWHGAVSVATSCSITLWSHPELICTQNPKSKKKALQLFSVSIVFIYFWGWNWFLGMMGEKPCWNWQGWAKTNKRLWNPFGLSSTSLWSRHLMSYQKKDKSPPSFLCFKPVHPKFHHLATLLLVSHWQIRHFSQMEILAFL